MITEFTCGVHTAAYHNNTNPAIWSIKANDHLVATVDKDGILIHFNAWSGALDSNILIEIAVLMNNIKRQYKQLQCQI